MKPISWYLFLRYTKEGYFAPFLIHNGNTSVSVCKAGFREKNQEFHSCLTFFELLGGVSNEQPVSLSISCAGVTDDADGPDNCKR